MKLFKILIISFLISKIASFAETRVPYDMHLSVYVFPKTYIIEGKEKSLADVEKYVKKYLDAGVDIYVVIKKSKGIKEAQLKEILKIFKKLNFSSYEIASLKPGYTKEKIIKEHENKKP